jgi:filamentous hemagglutinin family protein
MVRHPFQVFSVSTIAMTLGLTIAVPVSAQIIPDRTLPNNSVTVPNCVVCTINGGTTRGTNLFHSFDRFSIPKGGSAFFNNASEIQTIFTRVTGNQISNIDGAIRNNGTANLFLMNPNGIIFGPNANLNLGGSFVGTTANAIGFGNQGIFSASNPDALPLLTIDPSALIFRQENRGAIQVNGAPLQISNGRNFVLIGGDINTNGTFINAPNGRIELGSFKGEGIVKLDMSNNLPKLGDISNLARGDISIDNQSFLLVMDRGEGSIGLTADNLNIRQKTNLLAGIANGVTGSRDRSGEISINVSDQMTLQNRSFISNSVFTDQLGSGGNIRIQTGSLAVENSDLTTFHSGIGNGGNIILTARKSIVFDMKERSSLASTFAYKGQGNTGDIRIQAQSLKLLGYASLRTGLDRVGNAGKIILDIQDSIVLDGIGKNPLFSGSISSTIGPNGIGDSGEIKIKTGSLQVLNGSEISSTNFGKGSGGNISISAHKLVQVDGSQSFFYGIAKSGISSAMLSKTIGNGGNVQIDTRVLTVTGGGNIDASITGIGKPGDIYIHAIDSITVDGESSARQVLPSGRIYAPRSNIGSEILSDEASTSGLIKLRTNRLSLTNGGGISTVLAGNGNASSIDIIAKDSILIKGTAKDNEPSNIFTGVNQGTYFMNIPFQGVGRGGDIRISTHDLRMEDEGSINASAISQKGVAANIFIDSDIIHLTNKASIETSSSIGDGGSIFISAKDYISLRQNSVISTSSGVFKKLIGSGNGGNINISIPNGFLVSAPNENSDITTNAFSGRGGTISIEAQGIYWFTPRSRAELAQLLNTTDPTQLNPKFLSTNDITAISQTNPALSGIVRLNEISADPSRGLSQLSTGLVDPANKIDRRCSSKGPQRSSSFTITGTGGIPASPIDPLQQHSTLMELVPLPDRQTIEAQGMPVINRNEIVEAQGLRSDGQGGVWLVANAEIPQGRPIASPDCSELVRLGSH